MKKHFKNWKTWELIFMFVASIIATIPFLIFKEKNILSLICSIVGIVSMILISKGFVYAPILGVIYDALYIAVSWSQNYFGEVIIFAVIMIPMELFSVFTWLKNKNKQDQDLVQTNKLHKKEIFILIALSIAITISFYFVLRALNTNELIINTISLTANFIGVYLMFRRSKFYALSYFIDDLIAITLWIITIVVSGTQFIPNLICLVCFAVIDIYGFITWSKNEKKEKINEKKEVC